MAFGYTDAQSLGAGKNGDLVAQTLGDGATGYPANVEPPGPPPLVIEVDTTNTEGGSSNSDQFTLYLRTGTYNFEVDWGDGNTSTITTSGATTHTYSVGGVYEVQVNTNEGTFSGGIDIINTASRDRIKYTEVKQWGTANTYTYINMHGCSNMDMTATDDMVLTGASSLFQCFEGCTSMTKSPIWDFSGYTGTDQRSFYNGCSAMTSVDGSSIAPTTTNCDSFLKDCAVLTTFTGTWNTSSLTTTTDFYRGCNKITSIPSLDYGNSTSVQGMFLSCTLLASLGGTIDLSSGTSFLSTFAFSGLTSVDITTSGSLTTLYNAFNGCTSLTSFTISNTSNVTVYWDAFKNTNLTNHDIVANLDLTGMTNGTGMFNGVTLDTSVWSAILIDLDDNNPNTGVTIDGGSSQYSAGAAATARANLITDSWTIQDGGQEP